MVFAIRRLLLRSNQRLPNLNATSLRLSTNSHCLRVRSSGSSISTNTQLLRTPSCLQPSRQFSSSQRRSNDKKEDEKKADAVAGTKSEEAFEKELETRAEESSRENVNDGQVEIVKEFETPSEKEVEISKEVEETPSKEEVVPETAPQREEDSAVFEDVELPVRDQVVVDTSAKIESSMEGPNAAQETTVLKDIELPTKEDAASDFSTNKSTVENAAEKSNAALKEDLAQLENSQNQNEGRSILARQELDNMHAAEDHSFPEPASDDTVTAREASVVPQGIESPAESIANPEAHTNGTSNEITEEAAERRKPSPKNKSVEAAKSAREAARQKTTQAPVAAEEDEPSTDNSLQPRIPSSKLGEIIPQEKMLDISKYGRQYFNPEDVDDNFEINEEGSKLVRAWMKETGISLEKLQYYIDTYPGIDSDMIEAVEAGQLTEQALLELLEEIQEAEEAELPPEVQEKLKIWVKNVMDVSEHLLDDPNKTPEYTDLELKQLGLRRSDIEALSGDSAQLTAPQVLRIGRALNRAGLDAEEIKDLVSDEELSKELYEVEKQYGVENAPDPEIPMPERNIEVYAQVGKEVSEMQARRGMSDDRIMHYYEKFNGRVTAELIEAAEDKKITEERMQYYIEKYGNGYPIPLDSELIIAMDQGKIQEEAYVHVVESFGQLPTPTLVKAALKGDIDPEQIYQNAQEYKVPVYVIGSVVAGDITETQLKEFVEGYPGVTPDAQLIKDVGNGVYNEQLDYLRALGGMCPNVMSADNFRGLLSGEISEDEIIKAEKEAEEEDPWDISEDAMKAWQEEYGISDKMVAFLRDAYPGIWPDLVTSYAKGEITEADIPKYINSEEPWQIPQGMLERWLKESEVSEAQMKELREKFPKIWPTLLADVVHGTVREADVEKIIAESEAAEEEAKQANPWLAAGLNEDNIQEWQQNNSVTDEMLEYLLEAYPDITPDIAADFAEGVIQQKDIPDAIRKYQEKRSKTLQPESEERKAELRRARQRLSQAVRESEQADKEDEEAQLLKTLGVASKEIRLAQSARTKAAKPQELEIPSDNKGETTAERIAWYEKRFPGINIEQITLAEMGIWSEAALPALIRNDEPSEMDQAMMRREMLKFTPAQFKDFGKQMAKLLESSEVQEAIKAQANSAESEAETEFDFSNGEIPEHWQQLINETRAKAKLPGAKGLPTPANGGSYADFQNLTMEEYYQRMLTDGIDPLTMSEQEVYKLLEKKFSVGGDFQHTDADGNTIRHITPKSKEEFDQIRADAGTPMETVDWAAELASVGKRPEDAEKQADIEQGLDKYFGKLPKDEIEERKKQKVEEGFFNYGEENPREVGEDEEFQGDDISTLGHEELDQHRELREYARLAAWELPLLHKLAKPFEPPKQNQPLRFRYTTYFGAQHPADKKVVVEFAPNDIPDLTDVQRMKMIKLAGVRYNPSTGLIKMASESMETQAQNKRYLGDLVTKLIKESKDPKDTFEDIPVDFRHHKPKAFHRLPEGWKLTPERRRELAEKKRKALEADTGKLVDGKAAIEEALRRLGMAKLQENRSAAAAGLRVAVPAGRAGRPAVRGKVGQPLTGRGRGSV
ncbi:hypothetical protein FKW77_008066 [Venturia effusa]|uniref:Small ribosomal subunit protein mS35 mitochondrial conserved domain-containing protein n=1 Tax=Venturia effusa TaxID=50376 RepID=A0A517KWX8_9PEZI|nr:hypothetical protein FKW77_008066 [Venturia effusa]